MISWILSPLGKLLSGGLITTIVIGAVVLWHKSEYVSRAELNQWKQYASDLDQVYSKREIILMEYLEAQGVAERILSEMEKEANALYKQDSTSDGPVVLDLDDARKLREFLEKHR